MSELLVHNTLSGQLEPFKPIAPPAVQFYVCGVTVYDLCHIGHARVYVNFDCMRRYLTHLGYQVNFIQNFTDIDDKIIKRSQEKNIDPQTLTQTFIEAYFEDMDRLNIQRATAYPKATDYIPHMQRLIQTMIDNGSAYLSDGDVYFAVDSFPSYGKLSKKVLEDLVAGSRVEVSTKKTNPLDFVLWKAAKPGEPSWDSPWGPGRPGWHIECSAMAMDHCGPTLDVHGGGEDLVFPHHENEICQSESVTDQPFATYWIHNGFVTIKNEKMSKSLNNFFTLREVLKSFDGETIRFFLLKTHYRSPLGFSFEGLQEAKTALARLQNTLAIHPPKPESESEALVDFRTRFFDALNHDFNFTEGIGVLFELAKHIHKTEKGSQLLYELGSILGIFASSSKVEEPLEKEIEALIASRQAAKAAKDFGTADAIRKQLLEDYQVVIEDTKEGLRWKRVQS